MKLWARVRCIIFLTHGVGASSADDDTAVDIVAIIPVRRWWIEYIADANGFTVITYAGLQRTFFGPPGACVAVNGVASVSFFSFLTISVSPIISTSTGRIFTRFSPFGSAMPADAIFEFSKDVAIATKFLSLPAGDMSHKPGGRLPLLSVRPAVTLATLKRAVTNFAAWWTEERWVWTVCLTL